MSDKASSFDRRERWQPAPRPDWVARIKARPSYAPSCPPPGHRLPPPEYAPIAALAMA